MRPGAKAWIALGGGIVGWNCSSPDGEMFSEIVDDWLMSHPWLTRTVIVAVALHLANGVKPRYDPVHWLFIAARGARRLKR